MTNRRHVMLSFGAGAFAATVGAFAQQLPPTKFRVGYLSPSGRISDDAFGLTIPQSLQIRADDVIQ